MPRLIKGLGSGSKIPLRGFTQLLKNLDPGTRAQLEGAFSQAENLIDFHSRTVPEKITRRRFSGTLVKPIVITEQTIIGAFVRWDRIDDARIAFYEVDVSDNNAFASFDTFQTLETFFSAENVLTTKFIRVRGVRSNGEAGIYSDTVTLQPLITSPFSFSSEFYPGYNTDESAEVQNSFLFGKDLDKARDLPTFYSILDETFYADRLTGGFSVWGYMSNRLRNATAGVTPWDRVRFKINGISIMDGYFPHWHNVMDENAELQANKFDREGGTSEGALMTFYSRGGYTASFGPYNVTIPNSFAGDGPKDPNRVIALPADDERFYWTDFNNSRLPSRFDQAQLTSFDVSTPSHEAIAENIEDGDKTDYIYFHDFRFNMPAERVVTGIRAEVKRRQPNISGGASIAANLGVDRPDKDVGDDIVLNINSSITSRNASDGNNIVEDVDFGKFFDQSVAVSGEIPDSIFNRHTRGQPAVTDIRGEPLNSFSTGSLSVMAGDLFDDSPSTVIGDKFLTKFTASIWFNVNSIAFSGSGFGNPSTATFTLWDTVTTPSSSARELDVLIDTDETSGITGIRTRYAQGGNSGFSHTITPTGSDAAFDKFHHLVLVWNVSATADVTDLTVYLNGSIPSATTFNGVSFPGIHNTPRVLGIGTRPGSNFTLGTGPFKTAQAGIWDIALTTPQVSDLFDGLGTLDYRNLSTAQDLQHYFLFFPLQGDIIDEEIVLVDQGPSGGARIRTDLDNKALTTESWPLLGEFFYTDERQFGFLPLPESGGIPHDNHTAIGYQQYGGEGDLWGKSAWSPSEVNNFYFGFAVRAKNNPAVGFPASAFIDHGKLTLFFEPDEDRSIRAQAEVSVSNQFYLEREVFGALFNIIEIGERLASIPVGCPPDA